MDEFHDEVAMELDKRKIQKLLDDGTITPEDLDNANIVIMSANCDCQMPPDGSNRCPKCYTKYTVEEGK